MAKLYKDVFKKKFKPIDKFKGFTVTVEINRHTYLMFAGPRIVKGDWYASIMPPGHSRVTLPKEWKTQPTEDELLAAVKTVAPSVRKVYIRNHNN